MQSKPKANSVITTGFDETTQSLWWNVAGVGKLELPVEKVSDVCWNRAAIEGMSDRIVDKAALSRDSVNGKPATPQAKYEAMRGLVAHYASGSESWTMATVAIDQTALIKSAIMRVQKYDDAQLAAFVTRYASKAHAGDEKAALKYLATGSRVAQAMLEIRQERLGAAVVDADALLDEIPA